MSSVRDGIVGDFEMLEAPGSIDAADRHYLVPRPSEPAFSPGVLSDLWALSGLRLTPYLMALAAAQRGLKVTFWGSSVAARCVAWGVPLTAAQPRLFTVEDGRKRYFFDGPLGAKVLPDVIALSLHKEATKEELRRAGIAVPDGVFFNGLNHEAVSAFLDNSRAEHFVTKPVAGSRSQGVTRRVTRDRILRFLRQRTASPLMIEEQIKGREYRVYVVGERVAAAYQRPEAVVVGNGRDTIAGLVRRRNELRKQNLHFARKPIDLSKVATFLAKSGKSLKNVPVLGERVRLTDTNSKTEGGSVVEATTSISRNVAMSAIAACRAIGLPHGGVDLIESGDGVFVLETNAGGILDNHSFPETGAGSANIVAEAIIDLYFPCSEGITRDPELRVDFAALRAAFKNADEGTRHELQVLGA